MQNIRPRNLPAIGVISDFHEINLRTYIENNGKKGVYFLSIEAEKYLSAFIAKALSGLPYEKAEIKREDKVYSSLNKKRNFWLDASFEVKEKLAFKTPLDIWLTERYCLYLDKYDKIYRYDIHHKEWELKTVNIKELQLSYIIDNVNLTNMHPDAIHYSDGVGVLAWPKQMI